MDFRGKIFCNFIVGYHDKIVILYTKFTERRIKMKSEQQDRAVFVSFCIEQYAKAKNMTTEDVVNLFEQYGITEHFCEFYEVLHTQGHNWLIEEIDEMIKNRKK